MLLKRMNIRMLQHLFMPHHRCMNPEGIPSGAISVLSNTLSARVSRAMRSHREGGPDTHSEESSREGQYQFVSCIIVIAKKNSSYYPVFY